MKIRATTGEIEKIEADAAIITIFEDKAASLESQAVLDRLRESLSGLVDSLIQSGEIKGKANETTLIHTEELLPAKRILIVGLGKREDFSLASLRKAAGTAVRFLRKRSCKRISSLLHGSGLGIPTAVAARTIIEASLIGLYNSDLHKTGEKEPRDLDELILITTEEGEVATLTPILSAGEVTAEGVNLARDLGNEPANILTPTTFAERAAEVAQEVGLKMHILEEDAMQRMGMGGILAVSSGSTQPAKMVTLEHTPVENSSLLAIVGKGITFDSGGLSLKPRDKMEQMKNDMAGAAAVLGAMRAIARLQIPLNVIGIMPLTENLPGGKSYRPGDVITTMAGKTIEVISTDAEGRLVLSDALAYALQRGATHVIDIATLTGSCAVALGGQASGLFSNDEDLADVLIEVGEEAGERLWRLPLYPEYKDTLESKVADMKNLGGRYGDASNAAMLLKQFVGDKPWAHLDIAATDWNETTKPYLVQGPTGVGVGIMIRLAERMAKQE